MIDAVVLWVDGKDKVHKDKRSYYEEIYKDVNIHPKAKDSTRFDDRNEIWYCVNSIRKYAPYINKIFMVTDDQRPRWLSTETEKALNIKVIDHKVIFSSFEQYLPTFNSLTIETMLYRIPDLSNDFLCFCDDFFLINYTKIEDYFGSGQLSYRGEWLWKLKLKRILLNSFNLSESNKLKLIGHGYVGYRNDERYFGINRNRLFRLVHAPIPLNKAICANLFDDNVKLEEQIKYRFKSRNQLSPVNLAANFALLNGKAKKGPHDHGYLTCNGLEQGDAFAYLDFLKRNNWIKSLCIQSLDMADKEVEKEIKSFLEERIMS